MLTGSRPRVAIEVKLFLLYQAEINVVCNSKLFVRTREFPLLLKYYRNTNHDVEIKKATTIEMCKVLQQNV